MKKNFDTLLANSLLTFLKEYFTIMLFLPTLLGGLRQLYQLVSLSPSLIQFFSISQLLIDGILILIRIPLFLIGILSYNFYQAIKEDKKQRIKFWGIMLFAFIGFLAYIYRINLQGNYYLLIKDFIVLGTNVFFIFLYKFIGNVKANLKIFGLMISALLFSIIFDMSDKQYDYTTIENISLLNDKVNIRYPKAEFRYYNDRFIIFENPVNKKFIIKEFGDLFNNDDLEK